MVMTGDVVNGQSSCRCCVVFVVVEEVDVVGIVAVAVVGAVVVVGGGAVVVRTVVIDGGDDGDEASLTASCGDWCCLVSCGVVQNHRPGGFGRSTHHSRLFVTKSRARNSNRS